MKNLIVKSSKVISGRKNLSLPLEKRMQRWGRMCLGRGVVDGGKHDGGGEGLVN